jgi:hypothetical protein
MESVFMAIRLRELLATFIALLVLSPLTAPFAAYDLTGQHDFAKPQFDLLAAKTCVDEDKALLAAVAVAPLAIQGDVPLAPVVSPDESSKYQIPSRILRL